MSDQRLLDAILRVDFLAFIDKAFRTVAPGERLTANWHHEAIAHQLSMCASGETTRLVITQPPRSLKSIAASVAFPAWTLGRDPRRRFIVVSYSQDLANELARQFRTVVASDWYRRVFPSMRLARDSGGEAVTTIGGGRLATSIGGTLTGRGADFIVIDDPLKAEDGVNEVARRKAEHWYRSTLSTRLNDKRRGVIILVMQRLHEEDLAGHVLDAGGCAHLDLPAIAIADERIGTAPGVFFHRREGEALEPQREPIETLDRIRREIGTLRFSAQYQQRPVPVDGNLVKRHWFRRYDVLPQGEAQQSWDCASAVSEKADYSVCVTAILSNGAYYIADVWRGRAAFPDLKRQAIALSRAWRPSAVYIEHAGPGYALFQSLREDPQFFPEAFAIKPVEDKTSRLEGVSAKIEAGKVFLPRQAPWLDDFLAEIIAFPHARHDDQVDALSQLLSRPMQVFSGFGAPEIIRADDGWPRAYNG